MVPDLTPLLVLMAFGVVNGTLLAYLLVRWRGAGGFSFGAGRVARGNHPPGGTIDCPDCGATNHPEYRFCRQCVTELPAGESGERPASDASGQRS